MGSRSRRIRGHSNAFSTCGDMSFRADICSYTGVFLCFLTVNLPWYWGNLSVYTDSYFKEHVGPGMKVTSPWTLSCYNIGLAIGSMSSGHIAHFIGRKWTMVIACVVVDAGVFLSILSVQHSVISLDLSMGLAVGVGSGMGFTTGLQHIVSFHPKNIGMVTAFVTVGRQIGGACWNQLITWYINPHNLIPDLFEGRQKYFTQSEVLHKVTSLFLVLGIVFTCCHTIGIFLMRPNLDEGVKDRENISSNEKGNCQAEGDGEKALDFGKKPTSSRHLTDSPLDREDASLMVGGSMRQTLKTVKFYVLCFMINCVEYSDMVFVTFIKTYGQIWIQDDQFLAYLSTSVLFVSIGMQPVLGSLLHVCGIKFSVAALSCMLCVVSSFWYFTPMVSRWLYFFWTIMYDCYNSGLDLYIPILTLKFFGPEYFSKNYGMVVCSNIISSLLAPSIIQTLFSNYGCFYLFFNVGCMNAVLFILTMIWVPMI